MTTSSGTGRRLTAADHAVAEAIARRVGALAKAAASAVVNLSQSEPLARSTAGLVEKAAGMLARLAADADLAIAAGATARLAAVADLIRAAEHLERAGGEWSAARQAALEAAAGLAAYSDQHQQAS